MIKFFRRIRKQLLEQNNMGKYFKYAIGEITLVMIGILLALQVNNWNESRKELKLEQRYLSELVLDLQADSLAILYMKNQSNQQVKSKEKLTDYFEQNAMYSRDSLLHFFRLQWQSLYSFNPITTTIDEMKSTGTIGIVRNLELRRKILRVYNDYMLYKSYDEKTYNKQQEETWKLLFSSVPYLYSPRKLQSKNVDIVKVLSNFEIRNRIFGNYVKGLNYGLHQLEKTNSNLLKALREEIYE